MFTLSSAAPMRHWRLFFASLISLALLTTPLSVLAASTSFLFGVVTTNGHPAAGVPITVTGNNAVAHATTDANGRFSFGALSVGTYVVDARSVAGEATEQLDLSSDGARISLNLEPKEIGNISVVAHPAQILHGSGTDLTVNSQQLTRMPSADSLPEALIQLPGAARGANGVVHLNGDHGDINYIVDGVVVPQALNRAMGSEFDPNNIAFAEVLQGAYPAQYGERFASVVNIGTKMGTGPAGFTGDLRAGSYANVDSTLGYHAPLGNGSLVVAVRNQRTNRAEDPPNFSSPHNQGSNATQFLRYTQPNGNDSLNFTLTHSFHTYQIPNDVDNGEAASTDDNEWQDDTIASLQYRHAIGDRGSFSFGPGFKRSQIRDFGDPQNDFAFGEALNLGNGGTSTDCANALSSGNFSPATCADSLSSDKTAYDYLFNADYVLRSGAHEIRTGVLYDATNVNKRYIVALQPNNFLAPIFTPNTPSAPYAVTDAAPNTGTSETAYIQDSWKIGSTYQLDYGLRANAFQITSTIQPASEVDEKFRNARECLCVLRTVLYAVLFRKRLSGRRSDAQSSATAKRRCIRSQAATRFGV